MRALRIFYLPGKLQGPFHVPPRLGGSRVFLVLALGFVAALAGCARFRPASEPLETLGALGSTRHECLLVLLPGRRDVPEDFLRAGFPEIAARAGAEVDVVIADAHLGYYFKRKIVDRLRQDIVLPARARGYDCFWFAGVSIGGTGAMLYAREHPEDVDGIVALAPFLGWEKMSDELAEAGGLRSWEPPARLRRGDLGRRIWTWLERYEGEKAGNGGSAPLIPLYLGYGTEDHFAPINGFLAEVLPPARVFTAQGGHDWEAWRALWEKVVASGALPGTRDTGNP